MTRKVSLTVNKNPIKLDEFVGGYVYHVTNGILSALKDTGPIKQLKITVDDFSDVKLNLNSKDISLNFFTTEIVRNTLFGMVANLKGVEGEPKTLELAIEQ